MGNQGQAAEEVRLLCETIWDGAIGQVRRVHIWTRPADQRDQQSLLAASIDRPADTPPVPETARLGPLAWARSERPYNPAYLPFKVARWWDFGTGALATSAAMPFDPSSALKLGTQPAWMLVAR